MSASTHLTLLQRNRVVDCLHRALASHPLVALSSPPGYGKSIAAAQLALAWPAPTLYTSTPRTMPDVTAQWQSLLAGIEVQYPTLAAELARLAPLVVAEKAQELAVGMADCFVRFFGDKGALWVLDDAHNLRCHAAPPSPSFTEQTTRTCFFEQVLYALAKQTCPRIRVLLLSRPRMPARYDELQLSGLALAFDQQLLAFTLEEALEYATLTGFADTERVAAVWASTEGWPGAMRLVLHGGVLPADEGFVAFDVGAFIEETVFSEIPRAQGKLLVRLSAMRCFSPEQAERLTEDAEAPLLLQRLYEANAFITRDRARAYAFHPIFHDFLRARASNLATAAVKALHRQAADEYLRAYDPRAAVEALIVAGERRDTVRLLSCLASEDAPPALSQDTLARVQAQVDALTWKQRLADPVGYLAYIATCMMYGNMEQGRLMLAEAKRRLHAIRWGKETATRITCELAACQCLASFNNLPAMLNNMRQAKEEPLQSIIAKHFRYTLGSPHLAFLFHTVPGNLAKTLRTLLVDSSVNDPPMPPECAGLSDLAQAELLLEPLKESGTMLDAEIAAKTALHKALATSEHAIAVAATFTLARLELLRGNGSAALALAEGVFHFLPDNSHNPLSRKATHHLPLTAQTMHASMCRDHIRLCLGKTIAGSRYAPENLTNRALLPGRALACLLYGRMLLSRQQWTDTLAALPAMRAMFRELSPVFGMMHTHILEAIALFHVRGEKATLPPLDRSLDLAIADGLVASVAEYGALLTPVLEAGHVHYFTLLSQGRQSSFGRKLTFIRTTKVAIARMAGISVFAETPPSNALDLTERERLMLEMLDNRRSNAQIAAVFSLNTEAVKKALSRLYKKIGAKNRSHAAELFAQFQ